MRDIMLILHFLGLAMGLGTSFAGFFLGRAAAKMEPAKRGEFMMNTTAILLMGHIGLGLLILSGGYLSTPYWSLLGEMPLFSAKLVLVVVLATLVGMITGRIRRARQGKLEGMAAVPVLGRIGLLTGIAIVALAVLNFH